MLSAIVPPGKQRLKRCSAQWLSTGLCPLESERGIRHSSDSKRNCNSVRVSHADSVPTMETAANLAAASPRAAVYSRIAGIIRGEFTEEIARVLYGVVVTSRWA